MQYKCDVCHDSGSKNQTGDYLDCPACDMPMIRKALNDFVKSLGPTHPEDVALAIHQRALAMAPKQEGVKEFLTTQTGASTIKENLIVPFGEAISALNHVRTVAPMSYGRDPRDVLCAFINYVAAPAAANGALTDEQIDAAWDSLPGANIIQGKNSINWNSLIHRAFARAIIAAAGPDAALIKAPYAWVNAGTGRQQIEYATLSVGTDNPWCDSANAFPVYTSPGPVRKDLEFAAEQLAEYCENMGYYNSYVDDVRAALSGAKGN